MEHIVLERATEQPIDLGYMRATDEKGGWCLRAHGLGHVRGHVALNGRRVVCEFVGPDAESLRIATRQLGLADARIWTATLHQPPGATGAEADPASLVLVERSFPEPVRFEDIQDLESRGAWCLELHRVRFLRTYFSLDRRRMICVYDAPDAESVRLAQTKAGLPFDRVWSAVLYRPDPGLG